MSTGRGWVHVEYTFHPKYLILRYETLPCRRKVDRKKSEWNRGQSCKFFKYIARRMVGCVSCRWPSGWRAVKTYPSAYLYASCPWSVPVCWFTVVLHSFLSWGRCQKIVLAPPRVPPAKQPARNISHEIHKLRIYKLNFMRRIRTFRLWPRLFHSHISAIFLAFFFCSLFHSDVVDTSLAVHILFKG